MPEGLRCREVYDVATAHDADFFDGIAYDWEVIPMIMGHAEDADGCPVTPAELPVPEQVALLVAHRHLRATWLIVCRLEADRQWGYGELVDDHRDRVEQAFELGEEPADFIKWLGEKYDLTPAAAAAAEASPAAPGPPSPARRIPEAPRRAPDLLAAPAPRLDGVDRYRLPRPALAVPPRLLPRPLGLPDRPGGSGCVVATPWRRGSCSASSAA